MYARTLLSRCEWRFPILRGSLPRQRWPATDESSKRWLRSWNWALHRYCHQLSACTTYADKVDDAEKALEVLMRPLRGFPFIDKALPYSDGHVQFPMRASNASTKTDAEMASATV